MELIKKIKLEGDFDGYDGTLVIQQNKKIR